MVFLISGILFVTVVVIILAVSGFFDGKRESVEKRLLRYAQEGKKISAYHAEMDQPFVRRTVVPLLQAYARRIARFTPEQWRRQIEEKLYQAGSPLGLTVEQFVMIQIMLISIFPLLMTLFCLGAGISKAVSIGFMMFLIGLILPEYYLRGQVRERALQIQENLPDLLDLLTVSVEAGLGFDAALHKVTEKMPGPLAVEFKRLLQEIRMGRPRLEAFRELSRRSISNDLNTFCSAMIQADQLGVSIGKILRIQSEQMRTNRRQRAEEAAMKAPIKIIFPMVLLIFPALFIILMGPAVLRLIEFMGGM